MYLCKNNRINWDNIFIVSIKIKSSVISKFRKMIELIGIFIKNIQDFWLKNYRKIKKIRIKKFKIKKLQKRIYKFFAIIF